MSSLSCLTSVHFTPTWRYGIVLMAYFHYYELEEVRKGIQNLCCGLPGQQILSLTFLTVSAVIWIVTRYRFPFPYFAEQMLSYFCNTLKTRNISLFSDCTGVSIDYHSSILWCIICYYILYFVKNKTLKLLFLLNTLNVIIYNLLQFIQGARLSLINKSKTRILSSNRLFNLVIK